MMLATVAAVLGVAGGVLAAAAAAWGIGYPLLKDRRAAAASTAELRFGGVEVSAMAAEQRACDLRFTLMNAQGSTAVVDRLVVDVTASALSLTVRETETKAAVTVREHRVELAPGVREYDVRKRTFGPELPPLSYAAGDPEAFVVRLLSRQPQRYELTVMASWYDVRSPERRRELRSELISVDFPATAGDVTD